MQLPCLSDFLEVVIYYIWNLLYLIQKEFTVC